MLVTFGWNTPVPRVDQEPNCASIVVAVNVATSLPQIETSFPIATEGAPRSTFTFTLNGVYEQLTPFKV